MYLLILCSFLVTLTSILVLRPIAIKYNFIDKPNNRKFHEGQIPLVGGISIFFGLLCSQFFFDLLNNEVAMILTGTSLMLILGILDDFMNLKAKTKLIFQFIFVFLTIYFLNIKIETLGYLFFLPYSLDLGFLSIPFTIIAIVGLSNAFNMIDGLDGLAGSLSIIAIIGICFLGASQVETIFTYLLISLFSALIAFLIFNITPNLKKKIFLGDGGSLSLGFIISLGLVYNAENTDNFSPTFTLWCVGVPLFDFFSVIIIRKIKKSCIFLANRDHIHHFLEIFGFSKTKILIVLISVGLGMVFLGYFIENSYPAFSFPIFFALFISYLCLRFYFKIN